MNNDVLSIQNLVQKNVETVNNSSGVIDIKSLATIQKSYDDIYLFNPDSLIKSRIIKREKLLSAYARCYKNCLERIKMYESMNKVDIFFDVPLQVPECPAYNPLDCIEYIRGKLKSVYIDSYMVSPKRIFITWKYIEINKENALKFEEEREKEVNLY